MDIYLYILMLLLPGIAQFYVSSTYNKYKKEKNPKGITGFEVARKILDNNNMSDIYIVETKGTMSDHYDTKRKTVRLSSDVYHKDSLAALSIAAHECGHAIQDKEGYIFLKIRSFIFPVVKIGTQFAYIVLLVGIFLEIMNLIWLAILLVGLGLLFQIVTLPVEINASKKALTMLEEYDLADKKSFYGIKKMLFAAALTYVAGVLSSALQILRLVLNFTEKN